MNGWGWSKVRGMDEDEVRWGGLDWGWTKVRGMDEDEVR